MPTSIERHLKRIKLGLTASKHQREREQEDLAFQVPDKQWPDDVKAARSATTVGGVPIPARPMLSVAPVDEPIQLVSNQERNAHLAAKFHPLSEDADDDTAQVLQGLYDQGANESNAGTARSWGYERTLWCGTGWYRLDKVYDPEGGHPFDQKLIWERIKYQGAVVTDPLAKAADKRDRRWQYIIEDVPVEQYTDRYPDSNLCDCDDGELIALGVEKPDWINGTDEESRTIRIAEAWEVRIEKKRWSLYDDGQVYCESELESIPEGVKKVTGDAARFRDEDVRRVFWSTINCKEELEPEQEWDGQWIPLIPVIGRELQPFDGKDRIIGMIANAKDSVRLVNYAASGAVEMAALEPKAPNQLDPKQIEGYETFWQQSNTRNFPYLPYHAIIDGQPVPPPARVQVDVSRLGPNMQILSMGGQMLQSSMSTFDPALGKQPTAHRSGRALEALQGQTQEANSHYLDNLATISIPYEALVWLDLAPKVYDRAGRVVRILKGEGPSDSKLVMLGQPFTMGPKGRPQAMLDGTTGQPIAPDQMPEHALHFDLSQGRYGVSVTVGKSSASRLQAGSDALTSILQADPQLMAVVGPEWAKFQDFPGSRTLAELLKKMRDHQMPWLADEPTANMQAENQQLKAQLQGLTQAAQQMKKDLDTDAAKYQMQHQTDVALADLESKTTIQIQQMKDATQIEVARINAAKEGMIAEREAAEERLATGLKIQADAAKQALDHGHEATQAELDRQHEHATLGLEHGAAAAGGLQDHAQNLATAEQTNEHALVQADAQRQAAEAGASGSDANSA